MTIKKIRNLLKLCRQKIIFPRLKSETPITFKKIILHKEESVHIGKWACFDADVKIECWDSGEIFIGDGFFANSRCHLTSVNLIKIGNDVLLGSDVFIGDNNHGDSSFESLCLPPRKRKLTCKGKIVIEDNVWIGDKAIILSGVTIGNNSIVGAGSVVTKDIPPFSIAVGNPARVIKRVKEEGENV